MSHETPPPKNLREILAAALKPAKEFLEEPMPEGVSLFHTTGSMCLFTAMLQIVTGVLMAFYYAPTPEAAWESVNYVEQSVKFGHIIHGLHHWGSSAFVVLVFIHMLRVFAFAAYKGVRKWTWLMGVGLLFVVLGFGFTGYLLPWDMKAYFGTKVGTNIVGYAPGVGPLARRFLLGGEEISELTLTRFYALHVFVLPAALLALIGAHVYLIRMFGITPPWKRDDEKAEYPFRFFPDQALRDSVMIMTLLLILLYLAGIVGAHLEPKADPTNNFYAPHPEWYFLGMQQLLRYFEGKYAILGTVVIPAIGALLLVALPFIDRNPDRKLSKRPIAALAMIAAIGTASFLTYQGWRQLQTERAILAAEEKKEREKESQETAAAPTEAAPALAASFKPEDPQLIEFGRQLYEALECADCHVGEGVGKDLNIPPGLDFAGDRFTFDWLAKYMKEVPPRRFEKKGKRSIKRMPDFKMDERELHAIAAHLGTMKKPELFEGVAVDAAKATPERIESGKGLYDTESCGVCHAIEGKGGKSAPDLAGVGARLHPAFIFQVIKKPQSLVPETTMEDTLLGDEEVMDLAYYLMTLK